MKPLLTISIVLIFGLCFCGCTDGQSQKAKPVNDTIYNAEKGTKRYVQCIATRVHKGKKNHGETYCVAWQTIREYKDGKKDTTGWTSSGQIYMAGEYESYNKLSQRRKDIVDSLKEDGITQYQHSYLTYEPIYMKKGEKTEELWTILGDSVKVYKYLFWRRENGNGVRLLSESIIQ